MCNLKWTTSIRKWTPPQSQDLKVAHRLQTCLQSIENFHIRSWGWCLLSWYIGWWDRGRQNIFDTNQRARDPCDNQYNTINEENAIKHCRIYIPSLILTSCISHPNTWFYRIAPLQTYIKVNQYNNNGSPVHCFTQLIRSIRGRSTLFQFFSKLETHNNSNGF
jgi:hypothetical protein